MLLAAILFANRSGDGGGTPSISVDQQKIDYGYVKFGEIGLFQFIELQQRLEALLGSKVDLGTPRSLKPRIKEQVLQEAIRVA